MIKNIIAEAYKLYMPQVESEISDLANLVQNDIVEKRENDPVYQYNILEIGTKFGGTFYIWNTINPCGMNISIDMSDGGQHGGVSEEDMDKRDLWFYERFDNCHFIRGNSHDVNTLHKFRMLFPSMPLLEGERLPDFTPLDFLFIDGDHSYLGVKYDFKMYDPFVKKGGIIAFHDIVISDRHHERNVYVGEFWKDITSNVVGDGICSYNGQSYAFKEFVGSDDQDWAGIGVIQLL